MAGVQPYISITGIAEPHRIDVGAFETSVLEMSAEGARQLRIDQEAGSHAATPAFCSLACAANLNAA